MPARLSGVDAISPAIERTKQQLVTPFRYAHWWRLAALSLLTGELTGGGGGSWGGLGTLQHPAPTPAEKTLSAFTALPGPLNPRAIEFLPWIVVGVIVLLGLFLIFVYISCVFRFVLFDAVLFDRCELWNGWRRYHRQGAGYFLWSVGFALASFMAIIILIGGPISIAWSSGVFAEPRHHVVLLLAGGLLLLFFAAGVILLSVVGSLFAKDFVVPLMALENLGVMAGWRRVLAMVGAEKGAYAVYVLMKIVLSIGSAMLFGIIDFLVLLALLIPVCIIALVVFVGGKAAGLSWNSLTISMAVLAGGVVVLLLIYAMSLISVPLMVFFQAYTLHFFGSRYPLLGEQLALTSRPLKPAFSQFPGAAAPLPAS